MLNKDAILEAGRVRNTVPTWFDVCPADTQQDLLEIRQVFQSDPKLINANVAKKILEELKKDGIDTGLRTTRQIQDWLRSTDNG